VVEPRRAADVAVVVADHEEAASGEGAAEVRVPAEHLGAQAHDQQDRGVAGLAEGLVAELDVPDAAELLVERRRHTSIVSITTNESPARRRRSVSAPPIATAVVTCPALGGRSSWARHSADSASIFAVSP